MAVRPMASKMSVYRFLNSVLVMRWSVTSAGTAVGSAVGRGVAVGSAVGAAVSPGPGVGALVALGASGGSAFCSSGAMRA